MTYKTLKIDHFQDYTVIEIDQGKVNAINAELSGDIADVFTKFEKDDSVRGVILKGRPNCFSAGLDIISLAGGGPAGADVFWINYHHAVQAMVQFSKPFVCAITGYSPAGATIFTQCADYKIMGKGEKHVIGMHEFKMNMQIPELLCDVYAYALGEKVAWEAVQNAQLYNSDQALEIGLVNESVEVDEVMPRAVKHMLKLVAIHPPIFKKSKRIFRQNLLKIVDRNFKQMVHDIAEDTKDPFVRKMTDMFIASLKK